MVAKVSAAQAGVLWHLMVVSNSTTGFGAGSSSTITDIDSRLSSSCDAADRERKSENRG